MRSVLLGAGDEVGVKVPRVHHDSACAGVGDQLADLLVVRFRLGERVIQHDVDRIVDGHGGVDLGDHHTVSVSVEHLRYAHQHDVVVVHKGDGDCLLGRWGHGEKITALGVYWNHPKGSSIGYRV